MLSVVHTGTMFATLMKCFENIFISDTYGLRELKMLKFINNFIHMWRLLMTPKIWQHKGHMYFTSMCHEFLAVWYLINMLSPMRLKATRTFNLVTMWIFSCGQLVGSEEAATQRDSHSTTSRETKERKVKGIPSDKCFLLSSTERMLKT